MGIAFYLVFKEMGESMQIKLERASKALSKGIKRLQNTGFYRSGGESCLWSAKCQYALWQQTSHGAFLQEAVQSMITGILSTATGLKALHALEPVYYLLDQEIRRLV
jgi:hypothetical protein